MKYIVRIEKYKLAKNAIQRAGALPQCSRLALCAVLCCMQCVVQRVNEGGHSELSGA